MKHISIFFVASYSRQHWMIHEDAFPSLQNGLSEDAGLAHSLNSDRLLQSTLCMMEPTALHCRPEIKLNTTQEKAIKNLPLQHSGYSFFLLKRVGEIEVLRTLSQEPTGYCLALQELPSLGGSAGRWHRSPGAAPIHFLSVVLRSSYRWWALFSILPEISILIYTD